MYHEYIIKNHANRHKHNVPDMHEEENSSIVRQMITFSFNLSLILPTEILEEVPWPIGLPNH